MNTVREMGCEYFLDTWYKYLGEDEKKLCLSDMEGIYSRQDVEQLSGKLYNYLKMHRIGTNDFVLIDLPRSSKIFIAMIAVAKAGAAYVVVESDLGKERKEFIKRNINSKTVINEETFTKLDTIAYLRGYEDVDMHDAAFAIYTSGTTGTPKGVVHEYGNYCMLYKSIMDPKTGELRENRDTRFLTIAPFNFIASVMIFALLLYAGGCVFTPDYGIIKNIKSLLQYMFVNKITETFFSPSLLRFIGDKLNPEMKVVYTGSEAASNVSITHGELHNLYLMSEALFVLCQYPIEKAMPVTPVGKPNEGIEVKLNDKGEMIVHNPYCRGYLNPEENKAFDGEYYNTGDIAELDEDGNYVLRGRSVEMIKINGNRVEPQEVELVASKILGGLPCAVKGFENTDGAYLCLYYVAPEEINRKEVVAKMEDYLPYYMIPAHFIRLEELPRTVSGKVNKKALLEPAKLMNREFVEPRNATEEKFCEVFKKVLSLDKIGVTEDLFELGLTSLGAIEAITMIEIDDIKSADFYKYRTIENISQYYDKVKDAYLTQEEKELEGRKHLYPVNTLNKTLVLLAKWMPGSTAYNMSFALKFNKIVSAEKMRDCINKCTDNSMFKVTLVEDAEGNILQKYSPELYNPVKIEYMDENEVEELRKTFVQPFNIFGELPYRIRLIKTKKSLYFFFDVHHYLTDGMGMREFGENLGRAYRGKEISEFNYFAYCYDYQKVEDSQEFFQNIPKVYERFLGKDYGGQPLAPGEEIYYVNQEFNTEIPVRKINRFVEKNNVTRNTVLLAAANLYLAHYNKKAKNALSWMYANRDINRNQAGELAISLLLGATLDKKMNMKALFEAIENETNVAIKQMTGALYLQELSAEKGYPEALGVDDLVDVEELNPAISTITTMVPLERPYDVIKGVALGYTNLNYLNRGGELWMRLITDNSRVNEATRNDMLKGITKILNRLLDGDETVIKECLDFD